MSEKSYHLPYEAILLLILFTMILVFHGLVITQVIPFEIVWGGKLKDSSQMLVYESISIVINLLMLSIVGIKTNLLPIKLSKSIVNGCIWGMFVLFLVNTVGNIFSENEFEKMIFTPGTLLLALLSLRLVTRKISE